MSFMSCRALISYSLTSVDDNASVALLWCSSVATVGPKRESGETPELPRSGIREQKPSKALDFDLGSDG